MNVKNIFFVVFILKTCLGDLLTGEDTQYGLVDDEPIEIFALGRVAEIGELYDARTDKFLSINIFNVTRLPTTNIVTTQANHTSLTFTSSYSYEERFNKLDVSAELKLSILGGLCEISGSGHFMKDSQSSSKVEKASLIQKLTTVQEHISISDGLLKPFVNFDVVNPSGGTHMVVGIQWGGDLFISVESTKMTNQNGQTTEGSLGAKIQLGFASISGKANVHISEADKQAMNGFKIEIFGDVLPDQLPETFIDALEFMKQSPGLLKAANNGKGKAMKYTLMPIQTIKKVWKLNIMTNALLNKINEVVVNDCVRMFDRITITEQKVNDIVDEVNQFERFIPNDRIESINTMQKDFLSYQTNMSEEFAQTVVDIRSAKIDTGNLRHIIQSASTNCYNIENVELPKYENLLEEMAFIKQMRKFNVTFLGKVDSLKVMLMENYDIDIFVLYYKSEISNQDKLIFNDYRTMLRNRTFYGKNTIFAAINYVFANHLDNSKTNEQAKISKFRDESLIIDKYDPAQLKSFVWKPLTKFNDYDYDEAITGFFDAFQHQNGYHSSYLLFFSRAICQDQFKLVGQGTFLADHMYFTTHLEQKNIALETSKSQSLTVKGTAFSVQRYEILTNPSKLLYKWVETTDTIPPMAVQCGIELGQISYCGRRKINNVMYVPVRIVNGTAFAYEYPNGNSYTGKEYEYLVYV